MPSSGPIPAILNTASGSADAVRSAIAEEPALQLVAVEPPLVSAAVRDAVVAGARRIVVAGGDGTIRTAAELVADSPTELAIVPAGTLNHFARDHGIPMDHRQAAALAVAGGARPVDLGAAGDRLFLNTSAVGAYPSFVRERERLEPRLGYLAASAVAGLRVLSGLPLLDVRLEVDGTTRSYRTPLVFIGVGERELRAPTLGGRRTDGERSLHVMVLRTRGGARLFMTAIAAAARGSDAMARTPSLDSFLVDACRVVPRTRTFAVDGELEKAPTELLYRIRRDALRLVTAAGAAAE